MSTIRLYDSARRQKVEFTPLKGNEPSLYVCGPTVYDRAHLGNARPVVVFDMLYRLLQYRFGREAVTYVRNFTDVDDKITAKAQETGRSIQDITEETIAWFREDMDALGALRPSHAPRATEHIEDMIAMIAELLEHGMAYVAEDHVLFRVDRYSDYGALSGRALDDMIAGARVEIAPYKENPMDFVLWKPSHEGQPAWPSPWGAGRPGWHIECSAMARRILGDQFDIHGGGLDLQFPHHENEMAQSKACCGKDGFAQIWMHNEMLQVRGKKMSKSLGNFFTVRDLLDQGWAGSTIRFFMLSTHYRKPMDWRDEKAEEVAALLQKWQRNIEGISPSDKLPEAFYARLCDDLNMPGAIAEMHQFAKRADWPALAASLSFLGFDAQKADDREIDQEVSNLIERLLNDRARARAAGDYERADHLRQRLQDAGVIIHDGKEAANWELARDFDFTKLGAAP